MSSKTDISKDGGPTRQRKDNVCSDYFIKNGFKTCKNYKVTKIIINSQNSYMASSWFLIIFLGVDVDSRPEKDVY